MPETVRGTTVTKMSEAPLGGSRTNGVLNRPDTPGPSDHSAGATGLSDCPEHRFMEGLDGSPAETGGGPIKR
jgi:hypothetical protein